MTLSDLQSIIDVTQNAGFRFRGAFHPQADDHVPDCGFASGAKSVVLLGNVGSDMWPAFVAGRRDEPNAMDRWTQRTLGALLPGLRARLGGVEAFYPFGGPPYHPFQRWAMKAENVFPSPIGSLIHPEYGLWHAYRGALVLEQALDIPPHERSDNPCDTCSDKPCLVTCPVSAFSGGHYDIVSCANHMTTDAGKTCVDNHCRARRACPVGRQHAYNTEQSRFHMSIFRDRYTTRA